MIQTAHGYLIEYSYTVPTNALRFEFNPQTLSRTRTVQVQPGSSAAVRGGYDFMTPGQTPRASQGVSVEPESLSVRILFDATDRMNEDNGVAQALGIQPELDTIRVMMEPKAQTPSGVRILAQLAPNTAQRAFESHESASVILFFWGISVLPVFLTQAQVEVQASLPTLVPYRAEVGLTMQVIESFNPFYLTELTRQSASAAYSPVLAGYSAISSLL